MTSFNNDVVSLLRKQIDLLTRSEIHLLFSYNKSQSIILNDNIGDDDLEILDSLASRFGRTSELLSKQVIRTIFQLLEEYPKAVIDQVYRAEQLDLITSAEDILLMRKLRNQIVHEYTEEEWLELYQEILNIIPRLLSSINRTKVCIKARFEINA